MIIETELKSLSHEFQQHERFGYIHSNPENLGTSMTTTVSVNLPEWSKGDKTELTTKCDELKLTLNAAPPNSDSSAKDKCKRQIFYIC